METGKTSRYLKYAIGEILLVVTGILLALAINSWDIDRKVRIANKQYLNNMLEDLTKTKLRLNRVAYEGFKKEQYRPVPSFEEVVKNCDSILKLTYQGLKENHFNYLANADIDALASLLNVKDNTYLEMTNTGNIYKLKSDTLTKAITEYYKMVERETFYNLTNSEIVRDGLALFRDGFGKMLMDYSYDKDGFTLSKYPFYFDKDSKEYKNFQLGLREMLTGQSANLDKMNFVVNETDKLIAKIKKKLNHYD